MPGSILSLVLHRLAPLAALALIACGGDKGNDSGSDGVTDTPDPDPDTDTVPTGDTSITVIPWPYPAGPELESPEWVRGTEVPIRVLDAPEGGRVLFYTDEGSMGDGPCEADGHCFDLGSPTLLGEAIADADGMAVWLHSVPADDAPRHVFIQAIVEDPASEARFMSNPLLRYIAIGQADSPVTFTKMTSSRHPHPYTEGNTHTGGIAWVDYNNDFFADLFVSNGGGLPHHLFRNNGDGTFLDVSYIVRKPDGSLEDGGVKFADIDNDGDSDIIVPVDLSAPFNSEIEQPHVGGPNLLYLNRGDGSFDEIAEEAGILDPREWRNICSAVGDIDNDGFVDLYLGNWAPGAWPHDNSDRLLRNTGLGGFEEVTDVQGTDDDNRDTLTAMFFDADLDGLPDLYVGNIAHVDEPPDYEPDDLFYMNMGGSFLDATPDSPGMGDDAIAAMGMDIGDVDGDGDWDLYVTDKWDATPVLPKGNPLYLGNGDGTFSDNKCEERGVCTGWVSWPTNFEDFDNDGDVDLWTGSQNQWMPDQLFINDGAGYFTYFVLDGLQNNRAHGGSTADYDGDGDIDVFVWNQSQDSVLLQNDGVPTDHWMELRLFGTVSNRDAIGAVVRATTSDGTMMRRVSGGDSSHSQRELVVHFGLGSHATADVEITWPSGEVQSLGSLQGDVLSFVDESEGLLSEDLTFAQATWSASAQELVVRTGSTFGGRTQLATTHGSLDYDVSQLGHSQRIPEISTDPGTIEVTANRGGSWTLPVTVLP